MIKCILCHRKKKLRHSLKSGKGYICGVCKRKLPEIAESWSLPPNHYKDPEKQALIPKIYAEVIRKVEDGK